MNRRKRRRKGRKVKRTIRRKWRGRVRGGVREGRLGREVIQICLAALSRFKGRMVIGGL